MIERPESLLDRPDARKRGQIYLYTILKRGLSSGLSPSSISYTNKSVPSYARPAFESVGVWKYSLSEASCSIRRFNSDMRPSAVLMGMQSWQRVSPQG